MLEFYKLYFALVGLTIGCVFGVALYFRRKIKNRISTLIEAPIDPEDITYEVLTRKIKRDYSEN